MYPHKKNVSNIKELMELDYEDIKFMCKNNECVNRLCLNEVFWKKYIVDKYGYQKMSKTTENYDSYILYNNPNLYLDLFIYDDVFFEVTINQEAGSNLERFSEDDVYKFVYNGMHINNLIPHIIEAYSLSKDIIWQKLFVSLANIDYDEVYKRVKKRIPKINYLRTDFIHDSLVDLDSLVKNDVNPEIIRFFITSMTQDMKNSIEKAIPSYIENYMDKVDEIDDKSDSSDSDSSDSDSDESNFTKLSDSFELSVKSPEKNKSPKKNKSSKKYASSLSKYSIGKENYRNMIGRGSFGKVYKMELNSGEIIAVKKFLDVENYPNLDIIREINALTLLHDVPNIAQILGVDLNKRLIIMKYYKSNLNEYISKTSKNERLNLLNKFTTQMFSALYYMNKRGIVNGDLKSYNILVDEYDNFFISDFGQSIFYPCKKSIRDYSPQDNEMYTLWWRAPELLSDMNYKITEKTEIWAMGIIICEFIFGTVLFKGNDINSQIYYILSNINYDSLNNSSIEKLKKMEIHDYVKLNNFNFDYKIKDLLKKMLQIHPDDRISTEEIISIQNIEVEELLEPNSLKKGMILNKNIPSRNVYTALRWSLGLFQKINYKTETYLLFLDIFLRILANYDCDNLKEIVIACIRLASSILGEFSVPLEYLNEGSLKYEKSLQYETISTFIKLNYIIISCKVDILFEIFKNKDFKQIEFIFNKLEEEKINFWDISYKELGNIINSKKFSYPELKE